MATKSKTAKADQFYAELTAKIINLMETEGTNWTKPWTATAATGMPHNAVTNRAYRGGNVLQLMYVAMEKGFTSNQWATFNQWSNALGNDKVEKKDQVQVVRKGEKATEVLLAKKIMVKDKENPGEKKQIFWMTTYKVFNIEQLENVPAKFETTAEPVEFEPNEVDAWVEALGADIRYGGNSAHFAIVQNYIQLPQREAFHSDDGFYGTMFHELTHWTGHESRLDREIANRFGDDKYAGEELVAELGSAFLSVKHGITPEPRPDHARYLNSWISNLKSDPKAIYRATAAAIDAITFMDETVEEAQVPVAA